MEAKYAELKGYTNDEGKFSTFPGKKQKKKVALMLEYLSQKFEKNRKYSEMEVNEILNQHHSFNDPATLRRLMFGPINQTRHRPCLDLSGLPILYSYAH